VSARAASLIRWRALAEWFASEYSQSLRIETEDPVVS
jgi:hypothetical protein